MLTTSVALVIGFSMLCFGQFASTIQFGFLAALTMAVAWISDLMITPMLLHATPLITGWDLLRLKIGPQVVERSPLFRGLKASEVKRVALLGTVTQHAAGDLLLRQGDEGDYMLVLLSGAAGSRPATPRRRARARSARSSRATSWARWPSSPARAAPRRWSPPRTARTCASTRRGCGGWRSASRRSPPRSTPTSPQLLGAEGRAHDAADVRAGVVGRAARGPRQPLLRQQVLVDLLVHLVSSVVNTVAVLRSRSRPHRLRPARRRRRRWRGRRTSRA